MRSIGVLSSKRIVPLGSIIIFVTKLVSVRGFSTPPPMINTSWRLLAKNTSYTALVKLVWPAPPPTAGSVMKGDE